MKTTSTAALLGLLLLIATLATTARTSQQPALRLTIDASKPVRNVSPRHYGLMTEEINHSYDGGLYAELIPNRAFLDNAQTPEHWSVVPGDSATIVTIALDPAQPLNDTIRTSLRLDVRAASKSQPAGVANDGYWGIPVRSDTRYRASFYARAAPGFSGPVSVAIQSEPGRTVYAKGAVGRLTPNWQPYQVGSRTRSSCGPAVAPRPPRRRASFSPPTGPAPSGSVSARCSRRPGRSGPTACAQTSCRCWWT